MHADLLEYALTTDLELVAQWLWWTSSPLVGAGCSAHYDLQ